MNNTEEIKEIPGDLPQASELSGLGWTVKIRHVRHAHINPAARSLAFVGPAKIALDAAANDGEVHYALGSRGGATMATLCGVVDGDANRPFSATGIARCNETDNYCRKTGRDLAIARALELLKAQFRADTFGELTEKMGPQRPYAVSSQPISLDSDG